MSQTSRAFWACRRFSASSHTTDCGPSMTSAATSEPRKAGRQCRNSAPGAAWAIAAASTEYARKTSARASVSASWPMDTQVSVQTTSAPASASAGSVVTRTDPPVCSARSSAARTTAGSGRWLAGPATRTCMPAVAPPSR
jgi:hypothetical protein